MQVRRGPSARAAGTAAGQRQLNGRQTSGRGYRNLSEVEFGMARTNRVDIPMRDGTRLRADVFLPTTGSPQTAVSPDGGVRLDPTVRVAPALVSFSCYARQVQDLGAPFGFLEAGASDYFVPRGYAHVIVNSRGTGGSEGTFGLMDTVEVADTADVVEWVAAQPWCDGNVGGMGISYFAVAQLAAAVQRPPHLKAIFPFATLDDLYDAVWHRGVLNSGFFSAWLSAIGIMAGVSDEFWQSAGLDLIRRALNTSGVHARMEHVNGQVAVSAMKTLLRSHYAEEPFGRLWQEAAVEHPTHDDWWDERNLRPRLGNIDIPVYLGCQWDNVPMHLPSSFPVWEALAHNPNVRLTLIDKDALIWPWETMHEEALAWNDQWLKGRDTGIMDGPPIRYVIPGTDHWRTADRWPPPESRHVAYSLRTDGTLAPDEDVDGVGKRSYLHLARESGRPRNANPPGLPDHLSWQTEPARQPLDVVGDIELELDATITALDTDWIVLLDDLAPEGRAVNVTAGWLRAQLRTVDEESSRIGRPVLPCREPLTVPVGRRVRYRIPLTPNACRLRVGHRLRLMITSGDERQPAARVLGFTHSSVGQSSLNTVYATSRLLLPVLPAEGRIGQTQREPASSEGSTCGNHEEGPATTAAS
ncbi:CocE/NonD family hydrolase [Microlunatus ginsengisoli]|uniref:CocE/NonD family hydrolase n=2 Tax=Microlunatus ginsengisoli TaxID=363863 RepID=A0ABP6ZKE1_9ACTN